METVEVHKIVCELGLVLSRRYAEYACAIVYFWICLVLERFVELAGILFSAVKHCVFLPVQKHWEKCDFISDLYTVIMRCDVMGTVKCYLIFINFVYNIKEEALTFNIDIDIRR